MVNQCESFGKKKLFFSKLIGYLLHPDIHTSKSVFIEFTPKHLPTPEEYHFVFNHITKINACSNQERQ